MTQNKKAATPYVSNGNTHKLTVSNTKQDHTEHRNDCLDFGLNSNISATANATGTFTFLKNIRLPSNHSSCKLSDMVQIIKSDELKAQTIAIRKESNESKQGELKRGLPAVATSGQFNKTVSNANFISDSFSGLFIIDIDKIRPDELPAVQQQLTALPYIAFSFISPRGNGLKAAVKLPTNSITSDSDFKQAFTQLEAHFKALGITLDTACKDIRRLTYLCHDPKPYVNHDAVAYELKPFTVMPLVHKATAKGKGTTAHSKSKYIANNSESHLFNNCANILLNAPDGTKHDARLRAFKLLGGFVGGGQLSSSRYDELINVSNSIDPTGIAPQTEQTACKDGFNQGLASPIYPDEPQKDTCEIFNTLHKEGNATPLINLCGDLVGYWADDEASFKDNKVTGHFKLAGKPRAWIAPAQHAAHLNNVTGETVYACPRGIDADNVASHLKQEGVSFSIYDPNQSPEWHLFAMRSGTGFIFTADTKLSKKYAIKPSKAESEQSIFIDRNTMQADKKGGYLVARGVAGKYQNYLLGGSLEPAANAIIGYRKRYYQIRFKTLHDDVLAIGNPAIAKKSNYIDSVIIPEKLRDQVAYYDSLPIVQLTAETLKLSGVFVLDQIEGSGKSSKVAEILAHYLKRVLAITNTEALTGELADNLSCANYKDKAAIMSSRHNNRVAVCLNSLINQIIADFCNGIDVLIIDEIMSVLDALATGTHITESQRKPLYNALVGLIRDTPVVIIADANINQAVIDFIKSIRTDIYKAEFDFKLYKKPNAIFYNTEAQVIESAINRIKTAKDCVTIFTDSQAHARKIAEACCTSGQAIDDIALLHGENKGDYSVEFWRDIQTGLINYKALVASPVIGAGISLRENVDTEAFFIFTGHLNIPAYLQQLARNRSAENVHIHFDDSSDYDAHSCSSLDLLKSIKDATALDQYYLRSTQIAKELSGNKLEFLLRAMEGKGYSLSWANVEESTLDLKEISIAVKEQRVLAIQTAPNDAIVDTARKQILSNNSRATQAESNELIRFRIADMFLEDPDIDTAGKIDILPVAFNILRNLEIIRTPLSELKSLDQEDGAINSRKRNYVVTRDFLRLLGRAEQSPSRTVCKNIVLELIREQARYQSLISANMNFWKSNIDTLDCLAAVSRLCEKYLGFSIRRDEPGQYAIFYKYDLRAVDKRRAKNSYSLLINTPEKHAKKDEIFLNIFIKKLNFVKGSTPDNKRLVMPLVEKDNAIIYSTNNESHNPILETGDRISILNKLNPKQKVA